MVVIILQNTSAFFIGEHVVYFYALWFLGYQGSFLFPYFQEMEIIFIFICRHIFIVAYMYNNILHYMCNFFHFNDIK